MQRLPAERRWIRIGIDNRTLAFYARSMIVNDVETWPIWMREQLPPDTGYVGHVRREYDRVIVVTISSIDFPQLMEDYDAPLLELPRVREGVERKKIEIGRSIVPERLRLEGPRYL